MVKTLTPLLSTFDPALTENGRDEFVAISVCEWGTQAHCHVAVLDGVLATGLSQVDCFNNGVGDLQAVLLA